MSKSSVSELLFFIPDDEIVIIYEACDLISKENKIRKKIQDDYSYYAKTNDLFVGTTFNKKGKPVKTTKANVFFNWVLRWARQNHIDLDIQDIKDKYQYGYIVVAPKREMIVVVDPIEHTDDINLLKKSYIELKKENKKLKEENKKLKSQFEKKEAINKKKGRRSQKLI